MRRMVSRLMLAQIVDCAMSSFAAISCWVMPWPPSSTGRFMSWIFASSSRRSAGVSSGTLWRLPSVPTTGFGFAEAPFGDFAFFFSARPTVLSLTPSAAARATLLIGSSWKLRMRLVRCWTVMRTASAVNLSWHSWFQPISPAGYPRAIQARPSYAWAIRSCRLFWLFAVS